MEILWKSEMPKLILSMDGLVLKEIELKKERTTIGRKAHNDVQIDNLAISGEHATITTILNDAFLEDRDSTNGTYVNGQPIKKHALRNGDVIELGKYHLKYLADQAPIGGLIDSSGLGGVEPGGLGRTSAEEGFEAQETQFLDAGEFGVEQRLGPESATETRLGVIRILTGANVGKELELRKTLTKLGRPGAQVAVISRRPEGYYITHVEGENRPQLNGTPLGDSAARLRARDILDIAGTKMEFSLRD